MVGLLAALLVTLALPVSAGEVVIDKFSGLNTQDSSVAISPDASPDLLNVNITPGGTSVKKRGGYGLHKTLNVSTSAVHGGYYFQDINGSDVQLWGNDYFLNASVNGASPIRVATGTLAATWQCTDSVGYAYCVTSARDMAVRTAGTAATAASYLSGVPLGTMVTATPDRLVVAGVSGNESTLYFSQANTFTNFTTGVLEASPFTEVITSPGSRITHIRYACGKVLWWKDGSFGYSLGTDQYNLENVIISPNIGTLDNSSDEYNGHVYFRGQDSHIYDYDCANVTRLSRAITPTVQSANRRRANSWTQSTGTDFGSGASVNVDTTTLQGSIIPSTFSITSYSSTTFLQGTTDQLDVWPSSITLRTNNSGNVTDSGFEDGTLIGTYWTASGSSWAPYYTTAGPGMNGTDCNATPDAGVRAVAMAWSSSGWTLYGEAVSLDQSTTYGSKSVAHVGNSCSWTTQTISVSGNAGKRFKLRFRNPSSGGSFISRDSYILGGDITFKTASNFNGSNYVMFIDTIQNGSSTITSGSLRSKVYDIGSSSAIYQVQSVFIANASTPTFAILTSSASNGVFTNAVTSTGTTGVGGRYSIFTATIPVVANGDALTYISSITIVYSSTGSYYSAVNYASSLTSFDTFGAETQSDSGQLVYYVRASTGSFTVLSSTPAWYPQSVGATVNYASGTYMQMRADFAVAQSTKIATIDSFSFNWFEGSASDKAYIKYWNDYVWIAVSSGTSGLNNRIFRWDTLNQAWLLDDIPMNGMIVDNNRLFFGSPTAGKVYVYDNSLKTDDSGDIESYWRSKDFVGEDPFTTNTWDQADFIVKQASGTYLTATYTLDTTSSSIITLNLYDPLRPNGTLMRKGNNLAGNQGTFFNVRVGDTSSNDPWEVYGMRFKYSPLPWKPK